MLNKKNNKFEITDILLVIVIVLLLILILILFRNKFLNNNTKIIIQDENKNTTISQKQETQQYKVSTTEAELIKELSQMAERERIEYYCGKYLNYLDEKDYESAYNLLYMEFKKTYFPTYEDFVEYAEKTYPQTFAVEYDDITRQGTIYVLRLKLLNLSGNKSDEEVIQRIVIQENNYNDFVLSFQVI